jgi:hypothetical protein
VNDEQQWVTRLGSARAALTRATVSHAGGLVCSGRSPPMPWYLGNHASERDCEGEPCRHGPGRPSQDGRFILKLDEERVAALVADGVGKPFSPGAGRVMKGWIEVTHAKADWVALAKEAYRLAAAGISGKKSKRR